MLMQDNESTMLLHKDHPLSIGKGSNYLSVRCFFVVDKLDQKEVKIAHYPTEKMAADFSSKQMRHKASTRMILKCVKSGMKRH